MEEENNQNEIRGKGHLIKVVIAISILLFIIIAVSVYFNILKDKNGMIHKQTFKDYEMRGKISFYEPDYNNAIKNFEIASQLFPNRFQIKSYLGESYYKLERYPEAVTYFIASIKLNDNNYKSHEGLGWTYYQMNRYDDALIEFNKSISLYSNGRRAHEGLAWTYYQIGLFNESRDEFNKIGMTLPIELVSELD
jgi:tetratricopeptide (TPR) repeat protein